MSRRSLDWAEGQAAVQSAEGLRDGKKRHVRQQLSYTATAMFLERGFDAVRVAEVADACGVSEKTVFNYFPTKESLVLDRLEDTMASLRTGLAEPAVPPLQAALRILDGELTAMTGWLTSQDDPAAAAGGRPPVGDLHRATRPPKRHDGPVRVGGRRRPGRPGRAGGRRPGTADHGPGAAGTMARSG